MRIDKKEDGLKYAYDYRCRIQTIDLETGKPSGTWRQVACHYDRQAVYKIAEDEAQYSKSVVERYMHGDWIIDIEWLEKYRSNNRHRI